ncbi:MAG: tRNA (adenosine(37)-N6)-threonylcarbamoyltransferase complex ATPase subunit type 1 TsaE [Patescibacteria group bacterium]|nr:tRNA (adenosine(37)-N6)-threonylcarbamoyltransferase complex ATPase subunit type 1 TsaE [Patescibacteria group bacterium]
MASLRLSNLRETKRAAESAAKEIASRSRKGAAVLALRGELGSGKTTFIKFLARDLGVKSRLSSPTFLIMRGFNINNSKLPYKRFYHIDAYRLKNSKDLLALGFKNLIEDEKNIVAIEWADRIKDVLPQKRIDLDFKHGKTENERIIKITNK